MKKHGFQKSRGLKFGIDSLETADDCVTSNEPNVKLLACRELGQKMSECSDKQQCKMRSENRYRERDHLPPIREEPDEVATISIDQIEVKKYVGGLIKSFERKVA